MSAFVMAVGAVMWMKHMAPAGLQIGWVVFFAGLIGVLYTMYGWWADVIREGQEGHHTRVVSLHLRYGMIMFIASEVMFFVAWFWAYFDAAFFPPRRSSTSAPSSPAVTGRRRASRPSTRCRSRCSAPWCCCSGTTVTAAHHHIVTGEREQAKMYLWFTVILGFLFTCLQIYEYTHAHFAFSGNIYGATFFMATGFHGFHVIVGTIFLLVCVMRLYRDTHLTPRSTSASRRRLVLALRRRGVAVPLRRHLRLGP